MGFRLNGDIIYHGKLIKKDELRKQKEHLQSFFCKWGLEREKVVALSMKRTPMLLITIFALLERGISFLPLDLNFPEKRLEHMLDVAEVERIVTDVIEDTEFIGREVTNITGKDNGLEEVSQSVEEMNQELAYLLFTSGTTGLPKAVEVRRRGLENFIKAIPEVVDFPQESRIACFTSQTFDIFFLESVLALCEGMTVVLADEEERSNPRKMRELIKNEKINVIQMTPSALRMLQMVDDEFVCLNEVETIMVGGEVFPEQLLKSLQKAVKGKIYNMYGPTETTIWSMVADLTEAEKVHIGKPIRETEVCILDDKLEEVARGQEGEIGILGSGLAKGYRNDPDKTKENFVFIKRNGTKERVYRTGDYGFLSNTGEYIFCGRKDNQVKILGHRIEIEDIEGNVMKISGIRNAAVAAYRDDVKRLVCFYLAESSLPEEMLKKEAKKYLPEYMVPSKWIWVFEFLFTASNKVNRKAMVEKYFKLSDVDSYEAEEDGEEDPIFEKLKVCLEAEKEEIQLEDSVQKYAEDSLKYIQMIVALEECFGIEFDDEMLNVNYFESIRELVNYIAECI